MNRRLTAVLAALLLAVLPMAGGSATAAPRVAEQVLTWTADDDITRYKSAPTQAVAGQTTIVFENSAATGNTTGMPHTLTFDTTTEGYNHDVTVNILANPYDPSDGRHEVTVTLSPGRYRYFCAIPGHGQMVGELVVTDGGGTDTTPPEVAATVTGDRDQDGNYVGAATVTVTATDAGSGWTPSSTRSTTRVSSRTPRRCGSPPSATTRCSSGPPTTPATPARSDRCRSGSSSPARRTPPRRW